jgi:hypothetical protein
MDRILKGTNATLKVTFMVDGVVTDPTPATATVTIIGADGTALVTAAPAVHGTVGVFTYTLSGGAIANVDNLTARWTSALGTVETYVEVVGGFLFSLFDLKSDVAGKTTDEYVTARTDAEDALEQACGCAFVPRLRTQTFSGSGALTAVLDRPFVRAIRSVRIGGVALTVSELLALRFSTAGTLYHQSGWTAGYGNAVVVYEHGMDRPPQRVGRACRTLAKINLTRGPLSDRATQDVTEFGTVNLATPGMFGSTFGIPEVDEVVREYDMRVAVA